MQLSGLDLFLWIAGFIMHAALLGVLFARHRAASFPFFTSLIGLSTLQTPVLYMVFRHGSGLMYFHSYWIFAFSTDAVELLVLYEIAAKVFRPLGHWAPDVRRTSSMLLVASLVVAAVLACLAAPPAPTWRQALVIKGALFGSALMSELFIAMIVLSATVGLPWRTHVARLAAGLGVYSLAEILVYGAESMYGLTGEGRVYHHLAHVRIELYLGCLVYWTVALWREAPAPHALATHHREQLALLQARLGNGLSNFRSGRR